MHLRLMEKRFWNPPRIYLSPLFFWMSYRSENRVNDKEETIDGRETELGNIVCLLHDF